MSVDEFKSQIVVEEAHCKHPDGCNKMAKLAAGYCMKHLEENTGLVLRKSNIKGAGLGLFAGKKMIPAGTIYPYLGDELSLNEFRERYPNGLSDYVLEYEGIYYDARSTQSCLGRYVCDHRLFKKVGDTFYLYDKLEKNAALTAGNPPVVKILKDIYPGEELLTDYGEGYWKNRPGFSLEEVPSHLRRKSRKNLKNSNVFFSKRMINKNES